MEEREATLGVDFGTSNTTVFFWDKGKVERIQIDQAKDGDTTLLPSAVTYKKDGGYYCGSEAANHSIKSPLHVRSVKRVLGCNYSSIKGKHLADGAYGCQLEEAQNDSCLFWNPEYEDQHPGISIRKTPVEVVTDIFKHIKKVAEEKQERAFNNITLSFPSTFRVNQKAALREAARNAGFVIKGMITEPTAAGVHYRMRNDIKNRDVVLVFDFGGGTLDLSLMLYENDSFHVFASGGNAELGGDDIDLRILEYIKGEYRIKTETELFDEVSNDDVRKRRNQNKRNKLLAEIREQKELLQEKNDGIVSFFEDEEEKRIDLTEERFEKLISDCLDSVMNCLNRLSKQLVRNYKGKAIGRHRVSNSPDVLKLIVDSVILVGGSSKLKAVQKRLKSFFKPGIVHIHSDVQECVGSGAFHTFLSILDPKQHVREVLDHSLKIRIHNEDNSGEDTIHEIRSDTTYPFEVTYVHTVGPFSATIDLRIEKDMTEDGEADVCTLFNKKVDYREILKNLKSQTIGVKLSVGLDCVLEVYLCDYSNGETVLVDSCDV